MRALISILLILSSAPALADVTHSIDARFGVAYVDDPNNPQSGLQALYEGRYTTTITHESDGGLRFRFDIGVEIGNFQSNRPSESLLRQSQRVRFFE